MHWAEEADLLETVEARCRELAELVEPLEDLEILGRILLVSARNEALTERLKERMRREDEAKS